MRGFEVVPGEMGENVTTRGLDLLALPDGDPVSGSVTRAVVEVTGLRNPCVQIDAFQKGAVLGRPRPRRRGRPGSQGRRHGPRAEPVARYARGDTIEVDPSAATRTPRWSLSDSAASLVGAGHDGDEVVDAVLLGGERARARSAAP